MTLPADSKNRLSKLFTQVKTWFQATPPVKPADRPASQFPIQTPQPNTFAQGAKQPPETAKSVVDSRRNTVDSDQYEGASTVARIKRSGTENHASPTPASHKEVWISPSSVEPTPVWYRVAGYEDKAHKLPEADKPTGEQKS